MGNGQGPQLALGHHRRGLPDALGHAAAHRRPVRPGAVRRRSRPARPLLRHRDAPLDRPALRPDAERRHRAPGAQPGPAGSPAPGILAAPRLRSPSRVRRVLPVLRLPRRHRPRHPASGVHRSRDTQPRRRHPGAWPRDPGGHCTSCPPGTRSAPTARQPKRPPALAARLLARRAVGTCERHPGGQPLSPQDIAIGVAHRDQADQIRQALRTARPGRPPR